MSVRIALLGLTLLVPGSAATGFDTRDGRLLPYDPVARARGLGAPMVRPLLAVYSDGGYIADINGRRGPFLFRPGMQVVINGKGFADRAKASNVSLFDGPATSGMMLSIVSWTDTRVTVVVPTDRARLIPSTNRGRLLLQGVKPGNVWSRYEVRNIRFVVEP